VADADLVRKAGEGLLRLVSGDERWERFVWNVTDNPRLHTHPRRVDAARWAEPAARGLPRAWFRSERQTFIPVPGHGQSLFTIAVDVQLLPQVVDTPERARRLADAVQTMSPAVLQYRGLTGVRDQLLDWLASR
jgi:acyl carrier protein phosphodiesterase